MIIIPALQLSYKQALPEAHSKWRRRNYIIQTIAIATPPHPMAQCDKLRVEYSGSLTI